MVLPVRDQSHRVAAGGAGLDADAVHLDLGAGLVGDAEGRVTLVEGVVTAEVQRVPRVREGHPRRELTVEAN